MPNRTLAIDLHAHALIPEVEALVHGQEGLRREQEERADWATKESNDHNRTLFATTYMPKLTQLDQRIAAMDAMGIDMQAVSIVPQYNYWADRDLAQKIVSTANEGIAAICRASRPLGRPRHGLSSASRSRRRSTGSRRQDVAPEGHYRLHRRQRSRTGRPQP